MSRKRSAKSGRLLRLPIFIKDNTTVKIRQHWNAPAAAAITKLAIFTTWLLSASLILSGGFVVLISFVHNDLWLVFLNGLFFILIGWRLQTSANAWLTQLEPNQLPPMRGIRVAQIISGRGVPVPIHSVRHIDWAPEMLEPFAGLNNLFPDGGSQNGENQAASGGDNSPSLMPWVVYPHTELLEVWRQMEKTDAPTLLVVEGSRIIGTISRKQIRAYA